MEKGITSGTGEGKFSPYSKCSYEQILTFLWRAAGSPEPKSESYKSLDKNAYYYKAVQWAAENDIFILIEEFPCTRADAVKFMWILAGKPLAAPVHFDDVPADDSDLPAISWAVEQGITSGVGGNKFAPDDTCTRGQIATFLYRAFAN